MSLMMTAATDTVFSVFLRFRHIRRIRIQQHISIYWIRTVCSTQKHTDNEWTHKNEMNLI